MLSPNIKIGKGAKVAYSVLLPGAEVDDGAVVEYAIVGENAKIGKNAKIGGRPENQENPDAFGLTVLAPECVVEDGRTVAPKTMLDVNGKEVSR